VVEHLRLAPRLLTMMPMDGSVVSVRTGTAVGKLQHIN